VGRRQGSGRLSSIRLLKVLHGFQAPPHVTADRVRRFRTEHEAILERYELAAGELEARRGGPFDRAVPYWLLTARFGELASRAFLAWCDEALEVLDGLEPPKED